MIAPLIVPLLAALPALQDPPSAPVLEPVSSPLQVLYDDGLVFAWDGGELVLEGLFEVGAGYAVGAEDGTREPTSDFYLKRARPELAGAFEGGWRFRVEPKFTAGEVELEEAWVGRSYTGGTLKVGRMKAPFGLEEVRSRRHIHFPRFSILNQFSPAEDHGLFWFGGTDSFEYGAAFYNGTGGADEDDGKDIALRGMLHFGQDSASPWQLGAAMTWGEQSHEIGGDVVKNAGGNAVVEYAPGVMLDGDRLRLGLEWAQFQGPWMMQAELANVSQDVTSGGPSTAVGFTGAYFDMARVLSGENIDFGGVENPNESWVFALRVSALELDDDLAPFTTTGTFTDSIRSISIGLNYVPGPHTILRTSWTRSLYGNAVMVGSKSVEEEDLLTVELQLHF